jgi:hypothetical protein
VGEEAEEEEAEEEEVGRGLQEEEVQGEEIQMYPTHQKVVKWRDRAFAAKSVWKILKNPTRLSGDPWFMEALDIRTERHPSCLTIVMRLR